jgi:ABC-type nitrate/sulfonate/bicarbonate transport system substrate-binding protein
MKSHPRSITPQPRRRALLQAAAGAACLGSTLFAPVVRAQSAARPGSITTALSWIPNHQFAGMWIALEKGYFTDAGVRVEWRPGGPNTPNPAERVSSGEVGLGQMAGTRPLLDAINRGNDFVMIGTRFQRGPGGILSLARQPVREAKDLLGKRIILPSPVDVRTVETVLRMNRLSAASGAFKYVPGGFDPTQLIDGQGDAMLAFETNQPISLEARGMVKDKDYFFRSFDELGFPTYSNFLFATRRFIGENRDLLVRYLRAEIRGWVDNEANPALGGKLTAEKYGADFNLDTRRETRSNTLQLAYLRSADTAANGLFWVSRERMGGPIYEALRAGGMDKLPDPEKIIDMSLLREALRT